MQKFISLFIVIIFVGVHSTNAQQNLTLNEAVKIALKNSYDVQLVSNNLAIAKNNNSLGVAGALPTVAATANDNKSVTTIQQNFADASRNTTKSGVNGNVLTAGLTASVVLFNGYRIMAAKERLATLEKQNGLLLKAQMQNTTATVMQQYYNVVRQQAYLKTILKSIEASQQRLDIVKTRQQVGVANQTDILQSSLDLNALVQAKQNQLLVIAQAKADLNRSMVLSDSSNTDWNIIDSIQVDASLVLKGSSNAIENGISENPQLQALSQQIKVNQQIEKETKSLLYPTLRASTGYNFSSNSSTAGFSLLSENYGPFVGVNLAIPLYAGNASKKSVKNAKLNTANATLQYASVTKDIFTNATKTFEAYQNSLQQLPTETENYKMSQALLDLVMQKYQVGQATMVDVKQAQQSFENAGFRLVSLRYTAKVAEIELKRISNQLAF